MSLYLNRKLSNTLKWLFGIIFLINSNLYAQDFLGHSKNDIIRIAKNWVIKDSINKNDYIIKLKPKQVSVHIINPAIQLDYFFEIDSSYNQIDTVCNTMYLTFSCNECAEEYIDRNIHNKYRKWLLYEPDSYISSIAYEKFISKSNKLEYVKVPKMNITYTGDRAIIQIMFTVMLKEEWKTLIKQIK